MSENLKEEVIFYDDLYHDHPLILSEAAGSEYKQCSGCRRYIFSDETAYRCRQNQCSMRPILHEECAEMPREMRLSMHPQHTLVQSRAKYGKCALCDAYMSRIGYRCSASCAFQIHVGCAQSTAVVHAGAGSDRGCIPHPSHPQHPLTLLWRPGRSGSLRCDACATIHKGNSYLCIVCQYCIHESCAALNATATYHHHNHPLSLAYHLPLEYVKFRFPCDICYKDLLPKYWVYHCQICRYVVHINCAIKASPPTTINIDENAVEGVISFPMDKDKAVGELIVPYVMSKLGGILGVPHHNEMVKDKYKFHNHDHELTLISSSLQHDQEENSDDDDDDPMDGNKSYLACDGCTLPIHHKPQLKSCSSSSNEHDDYCNYYMSCGECKYFLHWACFHLPPELPSHPLHLEQPDHNLTLQASPKLDFIYCYVCRNYTNGLFYGCTKCGFKADIKCASLPDTIKHAAHPQHHLKLLTKEITRESSYWQRLCSACGQDTIYDVCYRCDICQIILHSACVLLPAAVSNRRWDKHLLPLTFDASVNHPSGFYCDICEQEMNPKRWMYHCRTCDFSLHPRCFPTAAGQHQNIMFGQRYAVADVHHHPLVHQLLTTKLHCDVCKRRREYGRRGFQCDSPKCDFFMCLDPCGRARQKVMQPVD